MPELTEDSIEQEIKNLGVGHAPRLTPGDIDAMIATADYWAVPHSTTTVCALTLVNGFVVIGKSACISSSNFDESIGKKVARDDARNKIWELEGYRLKAAEGY